MVDGAPPATADVDIELLSLATALARRAGALAAEGRRRGLRDVGTKSTPTDVVTEFDRAAEALIVDGLRAARAGDAVVGEEGASVTGTSGVEWFIDPIDGTTNFLYDLHHWSVSIAAADASGVIAGVVFAPLLDEIFTARRGGGAHRNGSAIHASSTDDLSRGLIATGFSYDPTRRAAQGKVVGALLPLVRDVRRMGSAALDLCAVACGRVDAYYEEGLNSWDMAAGRLIASEAGAMVTGFDGNTPRGGAVVAATPAIHGPLLAALAKCGAPVG